jgi:hypothetical protein
MEFNSPGSHSRAASLTRKLRLNIATSFALWLSCSTLASAAIPETQQTVPAISCPANDQLQTEKLQAGRPIPVSLDQRTTVQIAYYSAAHAAGIYAPKGWNCLAWDGSNGSILVVTPKRIPPPYFPLPVVTGPAVMIQSSNAGASGRFHIAIVAAQLFPVLGSEFITRVRQEHLISDSSFNLEPYPDDQLRYLSDRFVEYITPANHAGLGTEGLLEMSDLPVRGLAFLNLDDELQSLIEVRVRLPAGLNTIEEAIVQLETACIQRPRGC